MSRPSWETYFMHLASLVSGRSTCLRRAVGAILVKDRQILATGYNGPPRGVPHCRECIRKELEIPSGTRQELCYAVHAEQNVIAQAARVGVAIEYSHLYTTLRPCMICAKMIINAGISSVTYWEHYEDEKAEDLLTSAGVDLIRFYPK